MLPLNTTFLGGHQQQQSAPTMFRKRTTTTTQHRGRTEQQHRTVLSPRHLLVGCLGFIVTIYLAGFFMVVRTTPQQQPSTTTTTTIDKKTPAAVRTGAADGGVVTSNQQNNVGAAGGVVENQRKDPVEPTGVTIAWAVSITGCGADSITEGAAVLKHSIHLTSIHGNLGGRYDYKMYAIYHPDGEKCAKTLEALGYTLVRRDTPVAVADIKGDFLRERIHKNGCCGEKELIKLEAYTLTDHPIVVHMDLDTLVLKPMDSLFDWMLVEDGDLKATYDTSDIPLMWPDREKPEKVNAFFTHDCKEDNCSNDAITVHDVVDVPGRILPCDNMSRGSHKAKPVQGGFMVLQPDMDVYREYVEIVKEGNFVENKGWGGVTGVYYGAMTFQGIIPYYYFILHPGQAVELNRCVYNQMADNPKNLPTVKDVAQGKCMTGEEECEDCRNRPVEDVVSVHFTLCQKPWLCMPQDSDVIQQRLCRKFHHEWHRIRSDLEQSWGRSAMGDGTYQKEQFYGHCKKAGPKGYIDIREPFGVP